jgi:hypothetical protein
MRAALALALALGCAACSDGGGPEVPRVVDPAWTIAGNPDLGPLGTSVQQPVDFAVWRAADGSWQLQSCIRGTAVGGNSRLFFRWQGAALTDGNWTPVGIAMEADPTAGETPGGLQAPFVLRAEGAWHLFYGDWEHICHARSDDGRSFTRVLDGAGQSGLFSEGLGANTRDPMVLRTGDHYTIYDSASPDGHNAVFARTSTDLAHWGAPTRVAAGGSAGDGGNAAECPFVVARPGGWYYLFRTQRYGADAQTSVYRSRDPLAFGVDDDRYLVTRLAVAAPEIVTVGGETFIASLLPALDGIRVARLAWDPR